MKVNSICVIGDSLSSGELVTGIRKFRGGYKYNDIYDVSWLSNICQRNGIKNYYHYSRGGMQTNWWEQIYKQRFIESPDYDVCVISLGTNDATQTEYHIGSIADPIGFETFVGYYKRIIEIVHEKNKNTKILLMSLYRNDEKSCEFSKMIHDISDLYEYCSYLDFANNSKHLLNKTIHQYGRHYTKKGYRLISYDIERIIDECINK